jgi:hypothetical protein
MALSEEAAVSSLLNRAEFSVVHDSSSSQRLVITGNASLWLRDPKRKRGAGSPQKRVWTGGREVRR